MGICIQTIIYSRCWWLYHFLSLWKLWGDFAESDDIQYSSELVLYCNIILYVTVKFITWPFKANMKNWTLFFKCRYESVKHIIFFPHYNKWIWSFSRSSDSEDEPLIVGITPLHLIQFYYMALRAISCILVRRIWNWDIKVISCIACPQKKIKELG